MLVGRRGLPLRDYRSRSCCALLIKLACAVTRVAERVGRRDLYIAAHDGLKKRILEDRSYPSISVSMTRTDARFAATPRALIGQA